MVQEFFLPSSFLSIIVRINSETNAMPSSVLHHYLVSDYF